MSARGQRRAAPRHTAKPRSTPAREVHDRSGTWRAASDVEAIMAQGRRAIQQAAADGRTAHGPVPVMAFGGNGEVYELWSDGSVRPLPAV